MLQQFLLFLTSAASVYAIRCDTVANPYSTNYTVDLIATQTSSPSAPGFTVSFTGKIRVVDQCHFELGQISVSPGATNATTFNDAQLAFYGAPSTDVGAADGFPVLDDGVYVNYQLNSSSNFTQTFTLSALKYPSAGGQGDVTVGISWADIRQLRLYSLKYKFVLAAATLSSSTPASTGTGTTSHPTTTSTSSSGSEKMIGGSLMGLLASLVWFF